MSTEIQRLIVRIRADAGQLQAELDKANRTTGSFATRARASLNAAGAAAGIFAGAVVSAGAAAAAVFQSQRNEIDSLAKTAAKLGIPTRQLAGLDLAAEKSGLSIQALRVGVQRATRRISEAAAVSDGSAARLRVLGDSAKQAEARLQSVGTLGALRELGLDAERLASASPDEQLRELADAFQGVESSSDRVRLAFKLFDSEGVGLVNTLAGGAAGLDAVQREAESLGLALREIDTQRVERANDAITLLQRSSTGLARQFTAAAAPLVEVIATIFVESTSDIQAWRATFESSVDAATQVTSFLIAAWLRLDSAVNIVIGSIARGFANVIGGVEAFIGALNTAAQAVGVDVFSSAEEGLAGFRREAELFAETFIQDGIATAGSIDRVTSAFEKRVEAARQVQAVESNLSGAISDFGAGQAEEQARLAAEAERARQEQQLAALERGLATRREVIELDFQERLEQINAFREAQLIGEERQTELTLLATNARNAAINQLEEQSRAKRIAIRQAELRQKQQADQREARIRIATAQAVGGALTNIGQFIVDAAGENNKAALIAQKAFAIASIGINTAIGASRAIAELGPIAGPIAAAAIIAGGAAAVGSVIATSLSNPGAASGGTTSIPGGSGGDIGSGDVCGTVDAVKECGGGGDDDGFDDGRLGRESNRTIQVVQFNDASVRALVDEIRRQADEEDVLLFSSDSAQAGAL